MRKPKIGWSPPLNYQPFAAICESKMDRNLEKSRHYWETDNFGKWVIYLFTFHTLWIYPKIGLITDFKWLSHMKRGETYTTYFSLFIKNVTKHRLKSQSTSCTTINNNMDKKTHTQIDDV